MTDSCPEPAPVPLHLYYLSPRTVLRLSGPDRLRFLNGQVTQDVRLATGSTAVYSCVVNAKGQLEAVCHIREHGDSYLIDAPLELRATLLARLDRYIIADDVELTDESEEWHVAHEPADSGFGLERPMRPFGHLLTWKAPRLDFAGSEFAGTDLFGREPIAVEGYEERSADDFRNRATALHIPQWGAELTPGLFPPEAGLDRVAISYDKGCYIGQEVISRIKHAGKTNRHLVTLRVPATATPGCALIHEGREAGIVTSVSGHDHTALGFRKRKFDAIDTFQLRNPDGTTLEGDATLYDARSKV